MDHTALEDLRGVLWREEGEITFVNKFLFFTKAVFPSVL